MLLTVEEIDNISEVTGEREGAHTFAVALETKLLEKLCAGVVMPEAASNWLLPDVQGDYYTADQLRAYGAAQRLKALEDAALMCENESCSCCWTEDATEMASHLQDQIRALKGEAP